MIVVEIINNVGVVDRAFARVVLVEDIFVQVAFAGEI